MFHIQIVGRKQVLWFGRFFAGILLLNISLPAWAQNSDFDACLAFDRPACNAVLQAEPDNLTALFMRGLAAELEGDDAAALKDFDATAAKEPRHFGAQLWRQVAAAALNDSRADDLTAYLAGAKQLPPWPRVLAELYLGQADGAAVLTLAQAQPQTAQAEAVCAAEYHVGRQAYLKGDVAGAMAHFRNALATGATHVFEYQAAERAVSGAK
jgi:lipoprotein NlpI